MVLPSAHRTLTASFQKPLLKSNPSSSPKGRRAGECRAGSLVWFPTCKSYLFGAEFRHVSSWEYRRPNLRSRPYPGLP